MPSASLWAYSEENLSFICSSEKPAGFSELLFHRKGRSFQMLFFFAAPSVKMQYRTDRSLSGIALIKNSISAIYAQSEAAGIFKSSSVLFLSAVQLPEQPCIEVIHQ